MRIVDIDEESLKQVGQWPWPRTVLAELVDKLAANGAAAIGFDMVFPEPDRMSPANALRFWPKSDALAEPARGGREASLQRSGLRRGDRHRAPSCSASLPRRKARRIPRPRQASPMAATIPSCSRPIIPGAAASLHRAAGQGTGAGSLNWIPEHDQIIRRMPMVVRVGDKLYPSLAADMLRLAQGASTYIVKSSGASGEKAFGEKTGIVGVKVGDYEVPTEANGQMWIRFTPRTSSATCPAWNVLNGEIGKDEIEGRILIIGTSAAGLLDLAGDAARRLGPRRRRCTPRPSSRSCKASSCNGPTSPRPPSSSTSSCSASLIAFLIYRVGAAGSAVVGGIAIAAVVGISGTPSTPSAGWSIRSIPPSRSPRSTSPARCSCSCAPSASATACATPSRHYMAPALVERLADDPSRLKLGGETRDMTLLFSDVRGFTTISEGLDAEELTRFLNSLFTPLSNIILEEQGTIDKFMGDAVMAFWNAPLDDAAHPSHACSAALRMMGEMEELERALARGSGGQGAAVQAGASSASGSTPASAASAISARRRASTIR